MLTVRKGQEKQKMLLASDAGHFSMIRYFSAIFREQLGLC
jgi:hypothetical protein